MLQEFFWEPIPPKQYKKHLDAALKGYFCTDIVFSLSQKVLTETETKVLDRGLGFAAIPYLIIGAYL